MTNENKFDVGNETRMLLARLDDAIDRSCALRDILQRKQTLADLEATIGHCGMTRRLHREISHLERQFSVSGSSLKAES